MKVEVFAGFDWADDRLWLLFEPRTVFLGATEENKAAATDFALALRVPGHVPGSRSAAASLSGCRRRVRTRAQHRVF